jgi:hypothetical protein
MKFKKFVLTVGTIVTAYKMGELIGKAKGVLAVRDKYGKGIEDGELTISLLGNIVTFTAFNKKAKDE